MSFIPKLFYFNLDIKFSGISIKLQHWAKGSLPTEHVAGSEIENQMSGLESINLIWIDSLSEE